PTRVERMPPCRRNKSCIPQKQPPARIARSVDMLTFSLLIPNFEQLAVVTVALALELIEGNETKRCRVDAIAQSASLRWSVRKDMAKVTVSMSGAHLGSCHAVAGVHVLDHVFRFDRLRKARPTTVAIELVHRSEQRLARHHIDIESWFFVVPVFVPKRLLRAALLRDPVLFWR